MHLDSSFKGFYVSFVILGNELVSGIAFRRDVHLCRFAGADKGAHEFAIHMIAEGFSFDVFIFKEG
jgi:hypothetical protein